MQLAQERVVVAQNSSNAEKSLIYCCRAVELTRSKPRVTPGGSHIIPMSQFTLSASLPIMWNSSIYYGSYALCYRAQPTVHGRFAATATAAGAADRCISNLISPLAVVAVV